jgi:hypothetical protein
MTTKLTIKSTFQLYIEIRNDLPPSAPPPPSILSFAGFTCM